MACGNRWGVHTPANAITLRASETLDSHRPCKRRPTSASVSLSCGRLCTLPNPISVTGSPAPRRQLNSNTTTAASK